MYEYGLTLVTPPADEPVTTAEIKSHLRITHDDEDALLDSLVAAARQEFEQQTNRQLMTATWDMVLDQLPVGREQLMIPLAPLASVTSVTYVDQAGDAQVWADSKYVTMTSRQPGVIVPAYGEVWPTPRSQVEAATIRFVAGYGDADAVDALIKAAIKMMVGGWYEFREEVAAGTVARVIPRGAERIMAQYDLGDELTMYGA